MSSDTRDTHKVGPERSERIIAGAMSGTSADGVDVAIVAVRGRGLDMAAQLIRHHHRPYNEELRREIFAFRGDEVRNDFLARLAKLGRDVSLTYAAAVNEALAAAGMSAADVDAVAAHGQTLFHAPPETIQWLDPALIATETGCAVVSDFRRADLAAGGQGAPLVPFADYILFRHPTKNRVLLNIGGIANITYVPAGATIEQVIAFDTGPGNCISDYLIRDRLRGTEQFDIDGRLASAGTRIEPLCYDFQDDYYFYQPPPKSTDTPTMIALYEKIRKSLPDAAQLKVEDELATACWVAAFTIVKAWRETLRVEPDEIYVSGGGLHNRAMMGFLRGLLRDTPLLSSAELGVAPQAKEAMAFALLGAATLNGIPSNVPAATGARRAVVLGSITPRP